MPLSSSEGVTSNARAIWQRLVKDGFLAPRSIRLMYVRSKSASSAKDSCERPLASRLERTASPKACKPECDLRTVDAILLTVDAASTDKASHWRVAKIRTAAAKAADLGSWKHLIQNRI